eukprot:4020558-Prymnesium_polylepis.1
MGRGWTTMDWGQGQGEVSGLGPGLWLGGQGRDGARLDDHGRPLGRVDHLLELVIRLREELVLKVEDELGRERDLDLVRELRVHVRQP